MNKYRILFSKTGRAKYISHLDLMRTMQRTFVRAGLHVKHTEGFNPHPHMVFALPLSVGAESVCELMDFELAEAIEPAEISDFLNNVVPEGIIIRDAYTPETKFKDIAWIKISGILEYDVGEAVNIADELNTFFGSDSIVIEKKSKSKISDFDIIPCIKNISFDAVDGNIMLSAVIMAQNPGLNPELLINALRQKKESLVPDFYEFKRHELFAHDMTIFK